MGGRAKHNEGNGFDNKKKEIKTKRKIESSIKLNLNSHPPGQEFQRNRPTKEAAVEALDGT